MIHIEHLVSVVRVYASGGSFGDGCSKPKAVATVARTDVGTVEIMAAMGRLSRTDMREIAHALAAEGIHTIVIKRKTGHGVPCGRLCKTQGPFSYYAVAVSDL